MVAAEVVAGVVAAEDEIHALKAVEIGIHAAFAVEN